MRQTALSFALVLSSISAVGQTRWQLVWSDEFEGPENSPPDLAKWAYDLGNNNGWGNRELESYTSKPENAHLDGHGHLVIRAESTATGYTSARLKTQGRFTKQYGRIEARIKIPPGQGIWPAFWMLGGDIDSVGWPQCGEIDIMENVGREPGSNHGSLHGPGYSGGNPITAVYTLPNGKRFSEDYHTFAVEWSASEITFSIDAARYLRARPTQLTPGTRWVFDHPFFLLLNIAVGGTFPGSPDSSTTFPVEMLVDYVRIYQALDLTQPPVTAAAVLDAWSYGTSLAPGSLANIVGTGLADAPISDLFDVPSGSFVRTVSGTTVSVNGVAAPLTFVTPGLVTFQVPWDTLVDTLLNVEVARDGVLSNPIPIVLSVTAPSVLQVAGTAAVACGGGPPRPGSSCVFFANGLGPTSPAQSDGVPAPNDSMAPTVSQCTLTIGGVNTDITYCGMSPGLIVYQVTFTYPAGVTTNEPRALASLTVDGHSADFIMPSGAFVIFEQL